MGLLTFIGFESGDNWNECIWFPGLNVATAYSTTIKRTGKYSLQCKGNGGAPSTAYFTVGEAGPADGTGVGVTSNRDAFYLTFWLYTVQYLTSGSQNIATNNGNMSSLKFDSSGKLQLAYRNSGGTSVTVGSLSAALSLNAWHRIDFSVTGILTATTTGMTESFKVDGTTVDTQSGLVSNLLDGSQITMGFQGNGTYEFYFDDVILRDDTFQSDDAGVLLLRPNSAGNQSQFSGSYLDVDELPSDQATTAITSATAAQAETVGLRDTSAAGIGGTVYGVINYADCAVSAGTSSIKYKVRLRTGATNYDSSVEVNQPSTIWHQSSTSPGHDFYALNPNTSAAWTLSDLDSLESGLVISSQTGTRTLSCSSIGVHVLCSAPLLLSIPIVTSINPTSGPKAGSTAVTITGENFTGTTGVVIGGAAATSVSVVNDTSITCTTAAASKAGTYNVQVTNADGIGVLVNAFTYNPGNSTGNSGNNAGGGTTVTVSFPAGLATGDMMAMTVTVRGGTGTTITDPSGWNLLGSQVNSTTVLAQKIYWKIATSGDVSAGNVVITITSNKASGVCVKVPDVEGVAPQSDMQANGSSTSVTAPTLTPKRLGAVSIYGGGVATGTTFTPPTNWTEPASADTASTGGSATTRTTTEEAYRVLASLSATGTVVGTAASGAVNVGAQMIFEPPGLIDAPLIDNSGVVFAPTLSGAAPVAFVPYAPIYTPFLAQ